MTAAETAGVRLEEGRWYAWVGHPNCTAGPFPSESDARAFADSPLHGDSGADNDLRLPLICPVCRHLCCYGFGLTGGGYGAYVFCENDACDFLAKRRERDRT